MEFRKYETRAKQDPSFDSCKESDQLRKQAGLLVRNLGVAQVDTGYYESMYDRLLKASQAREGIIDEGDKYEKANEEFFLNKLIKENKQQALASTTRSSKSSTSKSRTSLAKRQRTKPMDQRNGFNVLS